MKVVAVVVLAVTGLILALIITTNFVFKDYCKAQYDKFYSIRPGMREKEVLQRLGVPLKVYERTTAPKNYYVPGWAHKDREISHKLLIYQDCEPIAYIYLDHNSTVEDVFVGGS